MITTLLVPLSALIFLNLNRFYQFVILSLSVFLPFSFGKFTSIPNFTFIEWLPFVVLLILINDLNPINRIEKKLNGISFDGIKIFVFAIVILIIWTIVSFVENELFAQTIKSVSAQGSKRIYFSIVSNIVLFFTTVIFVAVYFYEIDFQKYFKILLYVALFLGALRLFVHFVYPLTIPLLEDSFSSGGFYSASQKNYGGRAYRFGILSDFVSFGIPALFSYYVYTKKINFLALIALLLYLFLSGGRTIAAGTIIPIIIFSFLFFPKNFLYMIVGVALFYFTALLLLPESLLMGQAGRMTTFKQGYMGLDLGRVLVYNLYWETFLSNPFFGKGIGEYSKFVVSTVDVLQDFGKNQLIAGGHGSYISLLAIYGIGGITYITIMLFGGIIKSYKKLNDFLDSDDDKTAISVFTFMLLMIKSIEYLTGDNGLTIPVLFFAVGLISALIVLGNREIILSNIKSK